MHGFTPVALLVISRLLWAHPIDMGLLTSKVEGNRVRFTLALAPDAAAKVSGVDPSDLVAGRVETKASLLLFATLGGAPLASSDGACEWSDQSAALKEGKVTIGGIANCPGEPRSWRLAAPFLKRAPGGFELMVKAEIGSLHTSFVASTDQEAIEVSAAPSASPAHSWSEFILMGVQHIGATPGEWVGGGVFHLPDGIDHILFVLALVLAGGGWWATLKTVTGFTLGHSITLALATLGIVHLPSRLIESAIALSIAFVAAEALFFKRARSRWRIAMAFGLVHGLGFASALAELHLDRSSILKALVGFNVGVEIGQAVIVCLALPVLFILQKSTPGRRYAIPACALAILIAGSYWFVRRAFVI